jgi:hypothetical protein
VQAKGAAAILAFVSPLASFAVYGLVVVGFLVATIGGRWDRAMLWPTTSVPCND